MRVTLFDDATEREIAWRIGAKRWRLPPERAKKLRKPLSRAERNIAWIERHCRIPEGRDVGKPVHLRDWQAEILFRIYDNPAGTRRAFISFGKKNAKTTLTAFLVLLHLVGPEARQNTQIPSTAQSKDQAATLFNLAAKCVRMSPTLEPFVIVRDHVKELEGDEIGTLYKALSADAKTKHGMSPAVAVHDELGQVQGPTSALYTAIENAMGAHAEPLSIVISTQAASDADLLSLLIDDALAGHDPRIVCILYTAPEKDADGKELDPFTDSQITAANPAAGDFLSMDELRAQARDAKRMPTKEADYRNFTLNQRVDTKAPFISIATWKENAGEAVAFEDLIGLPVFGALDLSEFADLTAFVAIGWHGSGWLAASEFWLPAEGIRKKAETDRVPWDVWAKEGWLNLTPGRTVDYEFVAPWLYDMAQMLNPSALAFDRYNFKHLKPALARVGFRDDQLDGDAALWKPFGQGFVDMSPALNLLEADLLNGRMRHGGHPILSLCARNATVKPDPAGNRKLSKPDSHGRIDGLVSLAMARGVAGAYEGTQEADVMAMIA